MRQIAKRVIACILVFSLFPILGGCRKNSKKATFDSGAYSSNTFSIPKKEGYEATLRSVLKDGEDTCISVVYTQYDQDDYIINQVTDIFTVDDKAQTKYTLEVMGNQPPCVVLKNAYVYLGYKNSDLEKSDGDQSNLQMSAVFLDKKTGDLIRAIDTDFQPWYVTEISDGFVVVGNSTLSRYTTEGTLVKTIKLDFPCYIDNNGFFEDNGKYYIVEERDLGELYYHEVNFETGECPAIATSESMGAIGASISGKYFFNPDGEYRVNLASMVVECIAEWNNIDIRPPKTNLDTPSQLYALDDDRFAKSYEYRDGTAEVLIFKYDSTVDRSKVQMIKIGGYGVYNDPVLQWAVYSFNTSNKDYRVILEDYSGRFEGYLPEERRKATLELTQYFNQGNTPDIFYGTRFDYAYMGRNGMVEDLSGYMNDQYASQLTDSAKRLLYDGNENCFQLFSGYMMYGYEMLKSDLNEVQDTSIQSLFEYSAKKGIPCSTTSAADLVDTAIRYNFADLWGAYDGNRKISHDELVELVKSVLSLPIEGKPITNSEDLVNGRVLMCDSIVSCTMAEDYLKDEFEFIGYPSIHGTVHLAIPQSCLAISTTAKNKDKCWEMLAMLLSEDAQKQAIITGYIPITQHAIDMFCEASSHPESVTDEVLKSVLGKQEAVSQDKIDAFRKTVDMADTVATYDYGIFDIIYDEVNSYYSQNRTPEQIADTLEERLTLYMQENYQ